MKIFRDFDKIPENYKQAVVALGNFDGVHLGHRSIITVADEIAKANNCPSMLMSFEPHPREFLSKNKKREGLKIYNLRSKLFQIKSAGIKCVFLARFNGSFANLSADDFIKNILVDRLNVRHVITGENFYFGKNRQGDKNLLTSRAKEFGFNYFVCPYVVDGDGAVVSSSSIRELLRSGQVGQAKKLLGFPYHISGRVKYGEGRGQKLGFPTANIPLAKLFLPKFGVYAVRVQIDGGDKTYNAVANLGVKPTFGMNAPLLEVHLFDTSQNLYSRRVCVEFVEFIRDEQKFSSVDELKKQIAIDCEQAKGMLSSEFHLHN